ncbi:OmpA family protein [Hymenobacter negativus]|uniref:OmpA family protein n=1 Tax=Hymenobacter negativus TaxID=2795026 RepID=A0ABS3QK53_9BACT|nr:OmpA family protein [Hymenobacter negativus]MBO2011065.1 OmpA family protein [Hymenobacter negativus]
MDAAGARLRRLPPQRDRAGPHGPAGHHAEGRRAKKKLDTEGRATLYINFDTEQAHIKPESEPAVAEVVKLLQANPALRLAVEGHTDNAGTPAHNQQLSEARAQAVVAALAAQGIATARLQAAGFGQTKPLADNATEAGRAQNRRVELVKR